MYKFMFVPIVSLSLSLAVVHGTPRRTEKVTLCHCPVGNPGACVTITVGAPAAAAHLGDHPDDLQGVCAPALLWETEVDLGWETKTLLGTIAADDTRLVFRTRQPGSYDFPPTPMIGLSTRDGSMVWRDDSDSLVGLSEGKNRKLVFATSHELMKQLWFPLECVEVRPNMLHGWNAETGEKIAEADAGQRAREVVQGPRSLLVAGTHYVYSDTDCDEYEDSFYLASSHDGTTAEQTWSHGVGGYFSDGSSVASNNDGTLVFSAGWQYPDQCLTYAYEAETGGVKWSAAIGLCGHPYGGSDIVGSHDDSTVYVKHTGKVGDDRQATVLAYDAESGEELWQSPPLEPDVVNDVALSASGKVLIVSGTVVAGISVRDGSLLWSTEFSPGTFYSAAATTPTTVVVSGIENGEPLTRALRPDTGATVWSVSSQIEPRVLAVDRRGRRVYIAGPSPNGFFVEAYAVPGLIPVESSTWLAGGDL
jgi:hypothetical protein